MPDNVRQLWNAFIAANDVEQQVVPLFATYGMNVSSMPYGKDGRVKLFGDAARLRVRFSCEKTPHFQLKCRVYVSGR
jgi:hypothetical protein